MEYSDYTKFASRYAFKFDMEILVKLLDSMLELKLAITEDDCLFSEQEL